MLPNIFLTKIKCLKSLFNYETELAIGNKSPNFAMVKSGTRFFSSWLHSGDVFHRFASGILSTPEPTIKVFRPQFLPNRISVLVLQKKMR